MNFLAIFQPHLRLIYVFLCGLIVSTMTHISTLIILNLIVFSGLLIALIRYRKSLAGYFKYWLKLNFFTLLVWLNLKLENHRTRLNIKSNGHSARAAHHTTFQFDFKFNSTLVNWYEREPFYYKHCAVCHYLKNYFTYLFLLFAIFPCSVKCIKRWIWPCVHADTSQNLTAEPYLSPRNVWHYY